MGGGFSAGPLSARPRPDAALRVAQVAEWKITRQDLVFADDDGAIFIPISAAATVFDAAEKIRDTERAQAELIRQGHSLRSQVGFSEYLTARASRPELTFREHLRSVGGAIEQ
ncbi:hypothetical protein [Psychromicrobium lacuslunae]|uniref:hypothetical protein n=1 Tax=Psychromicrobium lacuslunae TaxID=1618207 RepID=UPI0006991E59|nr:hypothetical protein [Psychromicrobium lacuslunae]